MENVRTRDLVISVAKVKTPNFRYLVSEGLPLPVNPYSLLRTYNPWVDVGQTIYYKNGTVQRLTTVLSATNYYNSEISPDNRRALEKSVVAKATNSCLDKIKAQSLPLIQLYVERERTAGTLARLVDDCWFIARNLKRPARVFKRFGVPTVSLTNDRGLGRLYRRIRSNVRRVQSQKDYTLGDLWLQYRMFLLPTYHDLMSGIDAAADYEQKIRTFRVQAKASYEDSFRLSYDSYAAGILTAERPGTIGVTGGCTVAINYQISDSSLAAITSINDPLAAVWDLTPWSFLIDRFVDIGSHLDRRNATLGTTFRSGYVSSKFTWAGKPDGPWVNSYYPNKLTWNIHKNGRKDVWEQYPNRSVFEEVSVKRTVLTSYPLPVLEYPFRQGWKQITDELVLLKQFLNRRNKTRRRS